MDVPEWRQRGGGLLRDKEWKEWSSCGAIPARIAGDRTKKKATIKKNTHCTGNMFLLCPLAEPHNSPRVNVHQRLVGMDNRVHPLWLGSECYIGIAVSRAQGQQLAVRFYFLALGRLPNCRKSQLHRSHPAGQVLAKANVCHSSPSGDQRPAA